MTTQRTRLAGVAGVTRRIGSGVAIAALVAGGVTATASAAAAAEPDFGPNVTIFDETWSVDDINAALMAASQEEEFSATGTSSSSSRAPTAAPRARTTPRPRRAS
ncbi:hypothetical protein [Agromyces sp. NPDC056965]|uniref:hypothetical protein n=1 Tax=Agromyces sp. NPDC056965 TaxID=3345983 RepID=UPI00364504B2